MEESEKTVTQADFVETNLNLDKTVKYVSHRTKILFMAYKSSLWVNVLKLVTFKNPEIPVHHVLSAIKNDQLHTGLEHDIAFLHVHVNIKIQRLHEALNQLLWNFPEVR